MITTRCFQENETYSCLRRPTVLKAICEQMTVRVEDSKDWPEQQQEFLRHRICA